MLELVCEPVGEHPVGLVEDEDVEGGEGKGGCVPEVVDEPAWGGDDDVWAGAEEGLLGFDRQATYMRSKSESRC